jgi:hypothetical protein
MLSRRDVFPIILLTAACGKAIADESTALNVQIRAADHVLNAAVPATEQSNLRITKDESPEGQILISNTPKERAVPVILIIVGAIAAVNVAKLVLELVREYYYGGVLIDARVTPAVITNNLFIPPGTIIVIGEDGAKTTIKESDVSADL